MYIEAVPNRNSPPAVLLRESYRSEDGKVKKRTIANLSALDPQIIAGLKVLLKGGSASEQALEEQFEVERTLAHGHVAVALGQFRKLGMFALLGRGRSEERSICAALIVSRLLDPCSKLSLSRQLSCESATNTLAEELGLNERVSEKDFYSAMAWLLSRQERIERTLAKQYLGSSGKPVLYDLTSTYYEGSTCVLAQRGYSRDGKKGTRQINFGMLCSGQGCPVAVEVFTGNTADPSTVEAQVDKLRERFGMEKILLVGDRGMLTSARIEALRESDTISWISALQSSEDGLDFQRDEASIKAEAATDGVSIVRARCEGTEDMDAEELVSTYKSLSNVESAFRSIKTETLHVRPVFHRNEDMVRAHIFICMLAYHLQWYLTGQLKPLLFEDEVPGGAPRTSAVAKARRSEAAEHKAASKRTDQDLPVHGFKSLLAELATLCRVTMRPTIKGAGTFQKLTQPTAVQRKAFELLGFQPNLTPCSQ